MSCRRSSGDIFPDLTLLDHGSNPTKLSSLNRPYLLDTYTGLFPTGYPLIVIFFRGGFCPRDQTFFRNLVARRSDLQSALARIVAISVQSPQANFSFRAGLGADNITFLSDEPRKAVQGLGILDETEGEYARVARPYAFVLHPDLKVHKVYDGWFFVGRPSVDELLTDLKEVMSGLKGWKYEDWNTEQVKRVRIPQQVWANGPPKLGSNGLPVGEGVVKWFNQVEGVGMIDMSSDENETSAKEWVGVLDSDSTKLHMLKRNYRNVFFHYTAIPGEGYRTIAAGTKVWFEMVQCIPGLVARNIQRQDKTVKIK
ncbi:cold-shock DNA-binding domain protein [Jimgerdemannia flammicorona]|uniref:Cold-shock DNA-binding domain protein n=1 Tax=Jimgerdemannia flammicorona TaxID=994334 RepID=A0A433B4D6_9FUNG|nr:cold-shock DNA-binding domain protein [Jimgerdemannia flammicorona]